MARQDMQLIPGGLLSPQDQLDAYRRAQARAVKKVEEREHLRLELKSREYIYTVHGIIDTLVKGYEPMPGNPTELIQVSKARVTALSKAMDGCLRLLDRVLPPLKAIEVQDSPEKELDPSKMTTIELVKLALEQRDTEKPPPIEEGEIREPWPWE